MKRIYVFLDSTVLPEIKTVVKELELVKNLKVELFGFKDERTQEPGLLSIPDCFLVAFGNSPQSIDTASRLAQYCREQHLKVIPVFAGEDVYFQNLPETLSTLHILKAGDPSIIGKILYSLSAQPEEMKVFYKEISAVNNLWERGERANLTAQQLFYYAVALFYGIEVEADYNKSLLLQMCLLGNESFDPQMIQTGGISIKKIKGSIVMDYAESLKQYIETEIKKEIQENNFKDTEKILSYGYLLKDLGSNWLYGMYVDEVLRKLNHISALKCKNDPSVKAGQWLLQYYWDSAVREAENRYYDKMLANLLEILRYASKVLEKHSDFDIKRYLFQAASILGVYNSLNPKILDEVLTYQVLDTYKNENIFRPSHEKRTRSFLDKRFLKDLLGHYAPNKNIFLNSFFTKEDIRSEQSRLHQVLIDTVDLLLLCKYNCVSDHISVWFQNNMQRLADRVPADNKSEHLQLLRIYSIFLQRLLNAPYRSSSEALIYAALHMETFYDRHGAECVKAGVDKSEIYAVLAEGYQEQKNYEKGDYYKLKLFEIVSVRDRDDSGTIRRMLVDCYNTAGERLKQKRYDQAEAYIRFGWNCCKLYDSVPDWLESVYTHYRDAVKNLELE